MHQKLFVGSAGELTALFQTSLLNLWVGSPRRGGVEEREGMGREDVWEKEDERGWREVSSLQ